MGRVTERGTKPKSRRTRHRLVPVDKRAMPIGLPSSSVARRCACGTIFMGSDESCRAAYADHLPKRPMPPIAGCVLLVCLAAAAMAASIFPTGYDTWNEPGPTTMQDDAGFELDVEMAKLMEADRHMQQRIGSTADLQAAAATIYVSQAPDASDANDGTTWAQAKATIAGAFAAVPSTGATLMFGPGRWTVSMAGSNGTPLPDGLVRMVGQGSTTTIIAAAEDTLLVPGVMFSYKPGQSFSIDRIGFALPSVFSGGRSPCSAFIQASDGNTGHIEFTNFAFTGCAEVCFKAASALAGSTVDLRFENGTFDISPNSVLGGQAVLCGMGLPGDNGLDSWLVVRGVKFKHYGIPSSNQGHALYIYPSVSLTVEDCWFFDNNGGTGYSIQYYDATGRSLPRHSVIRNCYFGASVGVVWMPPVSFVGCTFNCSLTTAFPLGDAIFDDCVFAPNPATTGITVGVGTRQGIVLQFRDCLMAIRQEWSGVQCDTVGDVVTFSGCRFPLGSIAVRYGGTANAGNCTVHSDGTNIVGPPYRAENMAFTAGSYALTSAIGGFSAAWEGATLTDAGAPVGATFHYVDAHNGQIWVGGAASPSSYATSTGFGLTVNGTPAFA